MSVETGILDGSECYCEAQFLDSSGAAYTPSSLSYQVDDLTNGLSVVPLTAFNGALGSSVTITITSAQNTMNKLSALKERRQVLLKVGIPGGTFRYDRITYQLLRATGTP